MLSRSSNCCKQSKTPRAKRIKERYVGEAMDLVEQWRSLYASKSRTEEGHLLRYNLDQAAEKVGISRKTLEDYYYTLRKIRELNLADLDQLRDQKMGTVRKLIRKQKNKQVSKTQVIPNVHSGQTVPAIEEKNESSDTFLMSMLEEVNLFEPTPPTPESYEQIDNYYHKILDMDVFDFIRND